MIKLLEILLGKYKGEEKIYFSWDAASWHASKKRGMSKAIIHNSDYQSIDECKAAIDQYFKERDDYFQKFPKRAGKKIWGKELNKPIFDESKNFKDSRWR